LFKIQYIRKGKADKDSINDIIKRIQCGDDYLKEQFISKYTPFIIKTLYNTLGTFIDIRNSEEFSIGLSAFNESIECYNEKKNCNFFNFSEQVIKRKLYTFLNSRKKEQNTLPFSYLEETDRNFENKYCTLDSNDALHNIEMKDQYERFEEKLAEFGISFEDLVLHKPKHKDSLRQAINIAKVLAEDIVLYKKLMTKKTIPMGELLKKVKVNHKAIEKNRKFIISICIILGEDFEDIKKHIREYVD
jgi:RNA polymerase sigma factor